MQNEIIKQKLVQAYHIIAYLKLDDHTYTHLSSRSSELDSFYIYPFGMRFDEVNTEQLMKVTFDGEVIEGKEYQYNKTGYIIHGSIYERREDIQSIFHIHTPEIVAVSASDKGLLPISQWALHFYNRISYHEYDSLALIGEQGAQLLMNLAQNYTMLLRNHGSITAGRTIEEAMFYTYHLQQACKTQILALSMNCKLKTPSIDICEQAVIDLLTFEKNLGERDWAAWVRLVS